MAFLADTFTFDGVSCDDFELEIASVNWSADSTSEFASPPEISDSYVLRKWKPYFYGVTRQEKLSFVISCMIDSCRIDNEDYLTRSEIKNITEWLVSPNTYRWLTINQSDMTTTAGLYKYKCLVTGLELVFVNDQPCGFNITFTCDSPYAYLQVSTSSTTVAYGSTATIQITNRTSLEKGVYPVITVNYLAYAQGEFGPLSIKNETTNEELLISNIPTTVERVRIDCERGIISANNGINLYEWFNFVYPHLARGANTIKVKNENDNCDIIVDISYECPVDIGA